jgi:putative FmdB family regulatory protein
MPIYEYVCEECKHNFEKLVGREDSVLCPACSSDHLTKQYSRFRMGVSSSEGGGFEALPVYKGGGCGCTPSSCGCKN